MANYYCTIRSNYFHVKDVDLFKDIMSKVQGNEDEVMLWEEKDTNGAPVFAFGCYSTKSFDFHLSRIAFFIISMKTFIFTCILISIYSLATLFFV